MKHLRLKKVAEWMNAELKGDDKSISGIAIDSRALAENELFFALNGERVNGHRFIDDAVKRHAAGVVVSETVNSCLPQLYVSDTRIALGQLAKHYREEFFLPMAAITGSYGKTTVKEMLASILKVEGPTLSTEGNLNTDIGVPLTLMRLRAEHQFAVIEMGARKKGDIQYLMELAKPTVVLINNAGIAHIEVFGSEDEVKKAKGEMFSYLEPSGTVVMHECDPHSHYWKSLLHGQKIFTFGLSPDANVRFSGLHQNPQNSTFKIQYQNNSIGVTIKVPGEHNLRNAMAASSLALCMGASLLSVKKGLEQFYPAKGRLEFKTINNQIKIIDDTYNANPVSMRAALSVLAMQSGEKILVMGDMLELGQYAKTWHQDIGEEAKRLKVDKLFGFGPLTEAAVQAFGENARHYKEKINLIEDLKQSLDKNATITILVKGSRGMQMEEVVSAVQNLTGSKEAKAC